MAQAKMLVYYRLATCNIDFILIINLSPSCYEKANIRPVGTAYQQLIADWDQVLPTQSMCLQEPIVMPSEHNCGWAKKQREDVLAYQSVPIPKQDGPAPPTANANPDRQLQPVHKLRRTQNSTLGEPFAGIY